LETEQSTTVRAQLSAEHYLSEAVFEQERSALFGSLWIFAGLATFVRNPDEFFTCVIGGQPVVVQNFDGTLRAFRNACAHRGKLIQTEAWGRRPLVCGYHGWRYDNDGRPVTIPFESECYRFQQDERDALRLCAFGLVKVGNFIFVNVSENPLPLSEQFDKALLAQLEDVSESFDDDVLCTSWRGQYNWKLAYENLRDALHPRFVHTTSLNLEVRFGNGVESMSGDGTAVEPVPLPRLSFGGVDGELLHRKEHGFQSQVQRWGSTDAYFNWLLYPNTHIVSPDGGYLFSIEHHRPVSADVTELFVYYLTARKRRNYAGASSVLWEYAKGAKRILDEDLKVMEQVQVTLASGQSTGCQGHFEHQNRWTDRWYLRQLGSY